MIHQMKLRPVPFSQIRDGIKTVELRLHDEKRRLIRPGDRITFTQTETGETLTVRVTALYPFASFRELFDRLGTECCGGPVDMDIYYPPEDQRRFGVLGIGIACE